VRDLQAYQKGEIDLPTRERAPAPDPAEIRARLELSQHAFAGMLGVSVRTIQDWEQGRRVPRGPAQSLLRIADRRPEVFLDLS
jgi:putative transcriptional regulator